MPSGIVLEFTPLNMQVYEPFVPKQVNDLAAPVALAPAVNVAAEKSAVEYVSFHCSPAGLLPVEVNDKFSATLPPACAAPEESAKDTCAGSIGAERMRRANKNTHLALGDCVRFIYCGLSRLLWLFAVSELQPSQRGAPPDIPDRGVYLCTLLANRSIPTS